MYIKKKFIIIAFSIAVILSIFPKVNVQAAINDINIISNSQVTANQAKAWAKSRGATDTFVNIADLYFKFVPNHGGVNPAIAYAQAAKETNFGRFGGVLDESYHNPCGLKIKTAAGGTDYDKNAHKKFNYWEEGVQAHLDHLALYAGANGYPASNSYDDRQFAYLKGTTPTVNSLGGKWAPSPTYGEELNKMYNELLSYSGINKNENNVKNNSTSSTQNNNIVINSATSNFGISEIKPIALNASKAIDINAFETGSTVNIMSSIGWKNQDGKWYYYKSDNTKATGWIKPDKDWYYLKEDGEMATGWVNSSGTWYYLNDSGTMYKGWLRTGNSSYYLQGDGSMVIGLKIIDNKTYLFDGNGDVSKGWKYINNHWYYFNLDGSMLAAGWIIDGGSKYYLYDTGAMAKGWVNIDNAWYFLKDSGAMATGWWSTPNGDSYYLDPTTGKMVTNTTIDGYKIGGDGKRQDSSNQKDNNNSKNNNQANNNNTSNGKKTITVDAGHDYGNHSDGGTVTTLNGTTYSESDLDIQVAVKLKSELEKRGYNVVMTRNAGERPDYGSLTNSLAHRADVANNSNSSLFISIHHNAVDGIPTAKGVETYYSVQPRDSQYGGGLDSARMEKSKAMAQAINDSIANKLGANNRGAKSDASSNEGTLFVLRNTKMPAVLVETGFITNTEEAVRCASSDGQQKVAEAIADAIVKNL